MTVLSYLFGAALGVLIALVGINLDEQERYEYTKRIDFCYLGGVEQIGNLTYDNPILWRCDPTDLDRLEQMGYVPYEGGN